MIKRKLAKFLYRHFGIITKTLRDYWKAKGEHLQFQLDCVHYEVERYNKLHDTNYTSKRVIDEITR